jgi:hypothetical protein
LSADEAPPRVFPDEFADPFPLNADADQAGRAFAIEREVSARQRAHTYREPKFAQGCLKLARADFVRDV